MALTGDLAIPAFPVADLRARIGRLQRSKTRQSDPGKMLSTGVSAIDASLGGGLGHGALHEVAGAGPEAEHGTAATLLVAGLLARTDGPILWVMERRDLFPPALAAAGLHPDRVVYAEAGRPAGVLQAMEDALRYRDATGGKLAGVIGEVRGRLGLTASRRLQLAAEAAGVIAFVLLRTRRSRQVGAPAAGTFEPNAAVTRWRVACLPCAPPLQQRPDWPGLGLSRWQLDLVRRRGGEPASWIVEAGDAPHRLRLASDLANRSHSPQLPGQQLLGRRAVA